MSQHTGEQPSTDPRQSKPRANGQPDAQQESVEQESGTAQSRDGSSRGGRGLLGATAVRPGALPESKAWDALATMMSGLLGFGVPGYFADRWLGTDGLLTLLGLLLGMLAALTVIWFRYGTQRS